MRTLMILGCMGALALTGAPAMASSLVYEPINPSFGGNPLNGNWLISQATAQSEGGGGTSPSFVIDFPDFGGILQPNPNPIELPEVPGGPGAGGAN